MPREAERDGILDKQSTREEITTRSGRRLIP
jgi:hypothetical protein